AGGPCEQLRRRAENALRAHRTGDGGSAGDHDGAAARPADTDDDTAGPIDRSRGAVILLGSAQSAYAVCIALRRPSIERYLPGRDRDDRSAFFGFGVGKGKEEHQERKNRLRLPVAVIDPEPVIPIRNRKEGVGGPAA